MSLLIPGAGIYLAGDKTSGLRWFCALVALGLVSEVVTPLPVIPGIIACLVVGFSELVLTCWMLVRSFRPVPKMRAKGWLLIVGLACTLGGSEWTIGNQFTRAFRHPTKSMIPTLVPGDRFFVQRSAYWFASPRRGDVIVFETDSVESLPKGQFWVKRIAALPGENVKIESGRLVINGHVLTTPTILAGNSFKPLGDGLFTNETNSLILPDGGFFVVGDNATNSFDSRHFGPVPEWAILGKATKIYWPIRRAGDLR